MKVLVDTNIILDVWMDRRPFVDESMVIRGAAEQGRYEGYLCATTLTTLFYLGNKVLGAQTIHKELKKLLSIFGVSGVNRVVLEHALSSKMPDFEHAVLDESGFIIGVDLIVTRNPKDFRKSKIRSMSPEELIGLLKLR